jgi:hypothetical protein
VASPAGAGGGRPLGGVGQARDEPSNRDDPRGSSVHEKTGAPVSWRQRGTNAKNPESDPGFETRYAERSLTR